ncbi:hypothetical protein [Bartonella sp. LB28NMGDW]|uniref:hypothetical protein n=1 Tax=Bartonella sp. LB28NMGDW TaxID=3243549 RepID=UPI0035CECC7C
MSIFVKQETATKHITIGKDIDGDKIDITNKSDKLRIISGFKKAKRDKASMMLLVKKQLEESLEKLANDSAVVYYDKENNENGTINYEGVTFGKTTAPAALHTVANKITKNSTDVVNGGQLYSLGDKVAKSLGSGASFSDGIFTALTYKLSSD